MKTKAVILDVSATTDGQAERRYGGYRIFVFEQDSFNVIKNYLESFGVEDIDFYCDNEYYIGIYPCHIIADKNIDKGCAENLAIILDKCISLKTSTENYTAQSYTTWVKSSMDINAFMEEL